MVPYYPVPIIYKGVEEIVIAKDVTTYDEMVKLCKECFKIQPPIRM